MNQDLSNIDSVYKEMIIDLYKHPLNKKDLVDFDFQNRKLNPSCGDDIEIKIKFNDEGSVSDIGFQGTGCAISEVAASLLTDCLKKKSRVDMNQFTQEEMLQLLPISISHTRLKCALLAWSALKHEY